MKTLTGSKNRFFTAIVLLFAVLMISFSCSKSSSLYGGGGGGGGGNGGPGANEVWIQQGMVFVPSSITVSAGTTITWINKDGITHTVTSDTGVTPSFNSGNIGSGGSWPHTFATAGTYTYHCAIHPTMLGRVIVN